MAEDDSAAFFEQALAESRAAGPLERAGYVQLPDRCKKELLARAASSLANSTLFLSVLNSVVPIKAAGKFRDPDFPPERRSLIRFWELADIGAQVEWADFTWKRLGDTFSDLRVFDNIDPSDIKQGELGDCYFLSTLSALAENPSRITRLFMTQTVDPKGQYKITMMEMGHWKEYTIDDFMPMKSDTELAFSGPKVEKGVVELWVLLLEKAYAKKFGCYYDIQAGFTEEALTDLTGAPCKIVSRSDPNLWEEIVAADQRNFIITAGCVGMGIQEEDKEEYERLGLIVDHAYAVISAKELQVDRHLVRLLKVRNPWGKFEWNGDWSDSSSLWTEEAKKQVNFNCANDGAFWIALKDFQRYFESCTICLVDDSYWTQSMAMDQTKTEECSVVEMELERADDLYFMVCQVDERRLGGIEGGYMYSPCRIVVARVQDSGLDYICSKASVTTRDTWVHLPFPSGKYLVYIQFEWRSDVTDLFGVSVYCPGAVALRDVTAANTDFLERCFTLQFLRTCPLVTASETSVFKYRTFKLSGKTANGDLQPGLYFDLFENLASERLLLSVKHAPWENMDLVHTAHQKGLVQLEIEPEGLRILIKRQKRLQDRHGFKVLLKKVYTPAR